VWEVARKGKGMPQAIGQGIRVHGAMDSIGIYGKGM